MKKSRIFATIIMIVLAAFMLTGCSESTDSSEPTKEESRIAELEEQVSSLTTENEDLKTKLEQTEALSNSLDNDLISTFFWTTGENYRDIDTTFYSDCFCSQEIADYLVFVSPQRLGVDLKNGLHVYASLSTEGIVWSTDYPNFNPIKEDNQS